MNNFTSEAEGNEGVSETPPIETTASSPELCQALCQDNHRLNKKPCSLWSWEVSTENCLLWSFPAIISRNTPLPLGSSAFLSASEVDEDSSGSEEAMQRMKNTLELMRTVVGPRICPDTSSFGLEGEVATRSSSASACTLPKSALHENACKSESLSRTQKGRSE